MDAITPKYKGVRKRKWGKWVSEIRLPNSRERIWLGSFDSAFKAARAFDAALYCLRGPQANFNFPENPPVIPGGRSLTPQQIQEAAYRFACEGEEEEEQGRGNLARGEMSSGGGDTCGQVEEGTTRINEDETTPVLFEENLVGPTSVSDQTTTFSPLEFGYFEEDSMNNQLSSSHFYDDGDDFSSHDINLWNF